MFYVARGVREPDEEQPLAVITGASCGNMPRKIFLVQKPVNPSRAFGFRESKKLRLRFACRASKHLSAWAIANVVTFGEQTGQGKRRYSRRMIRASIDVKNAISPGEGRDIENAGVNEVSGCGLSSQGATLIHACIGEPLYPTLSSVAEAKAVSYCACKLNSLEVSTRRLISLDL